jgi:hypothetical protein
VAQYAVVLTFVVALMLNAGVGDGLSDATIGTFLVLVNISVLGVAVSSATARFIEEQKKNKLSKSFGTNHVEWACEFSDVKFKTTFDAIQEHSVPPSSCLVFWYTDMKSAKQALLSGIPAIDLKGSDWLKKQCLGNGGGNGGGGSSGDGDDELPNSSSSNNNILEGCDTLSEGGVLVTLHSPPELNEEDKLNFPVREVVLACSIPRRWLSSSCIDASLEALPSNDDIKQEQVPDICSLRLISAQSLQALRGSYFGHIAESKPWFKGGIFLPPKVIRRAYQLQPQGSPSSSNTAPNPGSNSSGVGVGANGRASISGGGGNSNSRDGTFSTYPGLLLDFPFHHETYDNSSSADPSLVATARPRRVASYSSSTGTRTSTTTSSSSSFRQVRSPTLESKKRAALHNRKRIVDVITPKTCSEYLDSMNRIRNIGKANGWAVLYHYTQPMFGSLISKTGFRMSTQGQGDGGVYFSTKSPASYGLGTEDYEKNIIVDCFGESRLDEYRGKHKLDLCIVYGVRPHVLSPAPGGRDNAVMIRKSDFEAMTYPHRDGNYFLRPDRILGIFQLDALDTTSSFGVAESNIHNMTQQVVRDGETKDLISSIQRRLGVNDIIIGYKMKTDSVARQNSATSGGGGNGDWEAASSEMNLSITSKTVQRIASFGKLIRASSTESLQRYVGVGDELQSGGGGGIVQEDDRRDQGQLELGGYKASKAPGSAI